MITDPIADMLTRIRNASLVKKPEVVLAYSKLKNNLADLLLQQGWLKEIQVTEEDGHKFLRLTLKYDGDGQATFSGLKRISKPGQRIYAKVTEIPKLRSGVGAIIISTSKGLMTDKQAQREKMGGEVICQIW